jgi:hypothetical protein
MIFSSQEIKEIAFSFDKNISINVSHYYHDSSSFISLRNNNIERFKPSNFPLIVKKLQNKGENEAISVNLQDLEEHQLSLNRAYDEMIALGNIEYLTLNAHQIQERIVKIPSLKGLTIFGKNQETLPDYLADLPNLIWLDVPEMRLDKIPECVFRMKILRGGKLKLKSAAKQLPDFFNSLPLDLEFLQLYNSNLTTIPEEIGRLKKLRVLNLSGNKLVRLPDSMKDLKDLEVLTFTVDTNVDVSKHSYQIPTHLNYLSRSNSLATIHTIISDITHLTMDFDTLKKDTDTIKFLNNLTCLDTSGDNTNHSNTVFAALGTLPLLTELIISKSNLEGISKLKALKKLVLVGDLEVSIREINDVHNLEFLSIFVKGYGNSTHELTLNKLTQLHTLILSKESSDGIFSFKNISNLASLKQLTVYSQTDFLEACLNQNPHIESLTLLEKTTESLSMNSLKKLKFLSTSLAIFNYKLPDNISQLSHLESLQFYLYKCENLDTLPLFLSELIKIKPLKKLYLTDNDLSKASGWEVLNLKKNLDIIISVYAQNPLVDTVLFDNATLKVANSWQKESEYFNLFNQIKRLSFDNITQRLITYGLACQNTEGVRKYLPNILKTTLKPNDCFYLTGKLHGMTKPQMKEQLSAKGFKLSEKLNNSVHHIVIGEGLTLNETYNIVTSNKHLHLSEYVTDMLNSPDDFFLLHDDHKDLEQQIIPLFLSEEEANHQLALEMLKGGGVPKRLLNYLFVFQGCHANLDIRREARKLFKRFASQYLANFAKGLNWDCLKGKPDAHYFNYAELNYWDCVLAYQQFRNHIALDRIQRTWTFSRDKPNTLYIDDKNIENIENIPQELALVKATGIIFSDFYSNNEALFDKILKIPTLYPQLNAEFHCEYGGITHKQYTQLTKVFKTVFLTNSFTVI